jgi:drug/metabolite transporter (DMT)-like permease
MSTTVIAGVAAAFGAGLCYDTAYALMAFEARRAPRRMALSRSLLPYLARRPIWIGAVLLNIAGWPLALLALSLVPLTIVQPTLALGLLLLLVLGARLLKETIGRTVIVAAIAIIAGVGGIAWSAPERTTAHAGMGPLLAAFLLLALVALIPWLSRRMGRAPALMSLAASAGAADTWAALASKLIVDEISASRWPSAFAWALSAGVGVGIGLTADMSALQQFQATKVGPIVLAVQVALPVLLAPILVGETWRGTPLSGGALLISLALVAGGAALLGASRAVSGLMLGADRDR